MPVLSTIGAGTNRTTPALFSPGGYRLWSGVTVLTNTTLNPITGGFIYTNIGNTSLNNCIVYRDSNLTQKFNNANFRVGTDYYYADNTGWSTRVHAFQGAGDTYVTIPKDVCNFRTNDCTIELFFCPTAIPSRNYTSFYSVGEPKHCQRLMGFISSSSSTDGIYNIPRIQGFLDWYMVGSITNPGIEWSAWSTILTSTGPIEKDKWYHFAFTRTGSFHRIYLNGVLVNNRFADTFGDWKADDLIRPLAIGTRAETCVYSGSTIYGMWNGFISDVRIVNGKSLYTSSNLTVPLRPLTLQGHRGGNQNITGNVTLACQQELGSGYLGSSVSRTEIGLY